MFMWLSKAQWEGECYIGDMQDNVTVDKHPTKEAAEAVCRMLEKEGFGGDGEYYPLQTWVVRQNEVDEIHEGIWIEKMEKRLERAQDTVEQLQKDRELSYSQLREKFDI